MKPNEAVEKPIFPDSEEAAAQKSVTGWVSRNNLFFGNDEQTARWDGATHVRCTECGGDTSKHYTKCESCREEGDIRRFAAREKREWDGTGMIYSQVLDRYFYSWDEVEDEEEEPESLQLVICEPVFAEQINPRDHYCDDLPDEGDGDVPDEIQDAFDELNQRISECKTPLCWMPGKFAVLLAPKEKAKGGKGNGSL